MSKLVIDGATTSCSQGTSNCTLTVLATRSTHRDSSPLASVEDYKMPNLSGFGMCQTQSNPMVAAATASAQGVLTPQSCLPVITSAWSPGTSDVTIQGENALTDDSTCSCQWTGSISISDAGQSDVEVG